MLIILTYTLLGQVAWLSYLTVSRIYFFYIKRANVLYVDILKTAIQIIQDQDIYDLNLRPAEYNFEKLP